MEFEGNHNCMWTDYDYMYGYKEVDGFNYDNDIEDSTTTVSIMFLIVKLSGVSIC